MVNYCGPFEYEVGYCEKLKSFLETNLEWMQREMELSQDSPYWHQVGWATLLEGRWLFGVSYAVLCSPWLALSELEVLSALISISICCPPLPSV